MSGLPQFSRQQIPAVGLAATMQAEIKQARRILLERQHAHPVEPKMSDVFGQLYTLGDAWEASAAETAGAAEPAPLAA